MNLENAEKLGNFVGKFVLVDKGISEARLRPYLWVKVMVDVYKPFRTWVLVKNDDGSLRWLAFKYERLSDICYQCGLLGHPMENCPNTAFPSMGVLDPRHSFGPWLWPANLSTSASSSTQMRSDPKTSLTETTVATGEDFASIGLVACLHANPPPPSDRLDLLEKSHPNHSRQQLPEVTKCTDPNPLFALTPATTIPPKFQTLGHPLGFNLI